MGGSSPISLALTDEAGISRDAWRDHSAYPFDMYVGKHGLSAFAAERSGERSRQGAGEGWALVGDAGHHKEFIVGDGITEEEWWRARDVAALPLFFFGQDEGRAPSRRLEEIVFAHASESPSLRRRLVDVMEYRLSPYEAIDVRAVIRWSIGAALRGSAEVLRDFLAMGRRNAFVQGELRRRRKLLAETAGEEGRK